ncbi:hypothetical protein CEXT_1311 [Caerostris extrusa]|uniref:Uncharacterized protein n=1 Tax=Caerostris extrusa TaxID=172846 RepID=A0AAV4SPH9_CAEEX|nr:hypothetical protein CEXT_1311 [Caerostris extrusa]
MPPHPYNDNRFVSRNPTPSYRRNLFPNHNVKRYFHGKTLYCLAIQKMVFTLSDGTLSGSVDNDAGQISQALTNVQAIKLDPPSDRLVQPCPYCQDKDCHRWLAVREGVRRLRVNSLCKIDIARLLRIYNGWHFTKSVTLHKIRVADLVMGDKIAYKNTWMLPTQRLLRA